MPIHRTIKNKVKNYTFAEVKVREATSNDPWGPSTALMSEIADMTYNIVAFAEIMQMIWKRLNDSGKNWRHVYKSLVLLDYLIKTGNERVVQQSKESILMIQTLKDFQYIDEGKDQGQTVREKSKQLVALLKDDGRIKNERTKALAAKERYAANTGAPMRMTRSISEKNLASSATRSGINTGPRDPNATPSNETDEDLQLQLALAMSKEEHEAELKRRQGDEISLQMAIEESKKTGVTQQRGAQLYDNSSHGLLDLSIESAQPSNLALSQSWDGHLSDIGGATGGAAFDPWGAPAPKQPSASQWDAPLYDNTSNFQQPPPYAVGGAAASTDVWSLPNMSSSTSSNAFGQSSTGTANTWGASAQMFPTQGVLSPTASNGSSGGHITSSPQNDFDFLSADRSKNIQGGTDSNIYSNLSVDPLAASSKPSGGDIWDMKGLDAALAPTSGSGGQKKTAQDFLGANSNLVDLDDLISKPPPSSNVLSPFSMTTTTRSQSPAAQLFAAKANEEDRSKSVPLNQMMSSMMSSSTSTQSTGMPLSMGPTWGYQATPPSGFQASPASGYPPMQAQGYPGYQAPGIMGMPSMYPPTQPMYPQQTTAAAPLYPQQHNPFL